jgi:ankyrin repeat protein
MINKSNIFLCLNTLLVGSASLGMNTNADAITQLHRAALAGYIQQVKALLNAGIPVDSKRSDGWTPLIEAACKGHEDVCQLLIAHNAQVHAKTRNNMTALSIAACNGHLRICQLLIQANAEIDIKDNQNRTPLIWALRWKHKDVCQLLIDAMLEPIKQKTDSIIAFLGCNRKRRGNLLCQLPYDVAKLIAHQLYELVAQEKQSLLAQINVTESNWTMSEVLRESLLDYVREQLKL